MDFGDPWNLASGLLIGMVGMALVMYGRKQESPKALVTGLVLCVFPYFVASLALMWAIAGGCLGGLYAWTRGD
jgi:hypothetical protein